MLPCETASLELYRESMRFALEPHNFVQPEDIDAASALLLINVETGSLEGIWGYALTDHQVRVFPWHPCWFQ